MSGLGELDRPGTPESGGAWDARSGEWAAGEGGAGSGAHAGVRAGAGAGPRGQERSGADAPADAPGPAGPATSRRGAVDPVKTLMHRHRELCERAVDPLEIAAGLEAHGVTDRTAARFRHRDVFSLAEEMYARVPRDGDPPPRPVPAALPRPRPDRALLTLLPGILCAATIGGLRLTQGRTRLLVVAVGVLAVLLALRATLRRGPLSPRAGNRPGPHRTGAWTCWLLAYAALGDGLLHAAVTGGPDGPPTGTADGAWPLAATPLLTLALACAPAAWCARLLAVRAGRRLDTSRGLEEFAASVRPLLLGTFTLYLCALAVLTALCAAALGEPAGYAATLTLGALLLLARLLTVHGFPHAPAAVLTAAAAAEVLAVATVFAGRLPGCGFLAVPVETLVAARGPAAVPVLICATAALTLLLHAARTLTRASAHARTAAPC
ncbi:hypothetical protein JCM4814A_26430 [Streptomyces phaeofaciens JCM 4814]|uniref:Integral membrane protein n=1 Tax=Streptomyces phaeofaciens TaxID=68254 RepID=A0A918H419_9ACTN|nr:hypothetical protein [Streptomyces phaeofaciens]GGT37090.1 hypothetical protein GCM10010226_11760 [Streptomyces phaeofaciens]